MFSSRPLKLCGINVAPILLIVSFTPVHVKANEVGVIQLGCDMPVVNGLNQIEVIAKAIRKDSKSPRFRVSWHQTLGSGADVGTFLYDRRNRTLKYYEITGAGYSTEWKTEWRGHYLFTGVTDNVLRQALALRDPKAPQGMPQLEPQSMLKLLPRLGCGKKKLKPST